MEMFEVCVTVYKPQRLRVPAETLEEAKAKVKAQFRSQRLLFEFDDISDAVIIERKEIPDVIPQMPEVLNKKIFLISRTYPDLECIVDSEDYDILSQYRWNPYVNPKKNTIYATSYIHGKIIRMHRFIMEMHGHDIDKKLIDHQDQNGLNNQKENLRVCTHSKNAQNSKKHKDGRSSSYKGVCFSKRENMFYAKIMLDGKNIFIGRFETDREAALAYNQKAIEIFGKFACTNKIDE